MLLDNPHAIDEEQILHGIERLGHIPRIQFSSPAGCTPEILARVNACCRRFGNKVCVRFYGHSKIGFDFALLGQIPEVRSLIIDLRTACNIEHLSKLPLLEELGIGIFDGSNPDLLKFENLARLRTLTLIPTRKNNVNLAPLASFSNLEELTLCGHAQSIDVLAKLNTVKKLGLSVMPNTVRLDSVRLMTGLETLWVVLGGRKSTGAFANDKVQRLRVDRIRGLEEIDLLGFPNVEQLCIEDQSRISALDLRPLADRLRQIQIFNMKNLSQLVGIDQLTRLESLWLGHTAIDPDELIDRLPSRIAALHLSGFGKRRGEKLKERIKTLGLKEAMYVGMLGM